MQPALHQSLPHSLLDSRHLSTNTNMTTMNAMIISFNHSDQYQDKALIEIREIASKTCAVAPTVAFSLNISLSSWANIDMAIFNPGMVKFGLVIDFSSVFVVCLSSPQICSQLQCLSLVGRALKVFVQRAKNAQAPSSPNKHACRNYSLKKNHF